MTTLQISPQSITIEELKAIVANDFEVQLSDESRDRITRCREYLDKKIELDDSPIYGVNTGFGALYNTSISPDDLEKLQVNLVRSHACGMGDEVDPTIVRIMMYLKARGLSYGHSGVQVQTVDGLIQLLNNDVTAVVYEQGSLGASGDLSPLAHMSLPLIGEGKVNFRGSVTDTANAISQLDFNPVTLKSKEGLALLNGTQFMSAYGCYLLLKLSSLLDWSEAIGAMSIDAYDGRIEPFGVEVNTIRNQPGQINVAENIRHWLSGSEIISREKKHVQDPYSFRCIPQVHGAVRDAVNLVKQVFENEINAVTDNPTIFPEKDLVVSAGNFHGEPLAMALDQLAIAASELGSISERRTYKLISGGRELPSFLVKNPGLNSGFMIPQYTAASIVSQNKTLCTPASVDTIDSSNGQEDHVSMGANAATKAKRVVDNVARILGVELMNAAQAIQFRRPLKTSPKLESLLADYREAVPFVEDDTIMHNLMEASHRFVLDNECDKWG